MSAVFAPQRERILRCAPRSAEPAATSWTAVLDDLETEVLAVEARIGDGDWSAETEAWHPPVAPREPFTAQEQARARQLIGRMRACTARIDAELEATAGQLAEHPTRRSAAAAYRRA